MLFENEKRNKKNKERNESCNKFDGDFRKNGCTDIIDIIIIITIGILLCRMLRIEKFMVVFLSTSIQHFKITAVVMFILPFSLGVDYLTTDAYFFNLNCQSC